MQLGLNTTWRYLPPPDGTTTAAVRTAAANNFPKITGHSVEAGIVAFLKDKQYRLLIER
jgi:hypothetical protein